LKEKIALKEFNNLEEPLILSLTGDLICESPNEFLEKFDGNLTFEIPELRKLTTIKVGYATLVL
jgi:hypothetical protein